MTSLILFLIISLSDDGGCMRKDSHVFTLNKEGETDVDGVLKLLVNKE